MQLLKFDDWLVIYCHTLLDIWLPMLGLELIRVSKRGPYWFEFKNEINVISMMYAFLTLLTSDANCVLIGHVTLKVIIGMTTLLPHIQVKSLQPFGVQSP